jgi:hypothetical protein
MLPSLALHLALRPDMDLRPRYSSQQPAGAQTAWPILRVPPESRRFEIFSKRFKCESLRLIFDGNFYFRTKIIVAAVQFEPCRAEATG